MAEALFHRRRHWAWKLLPAPVLPMSQAELGELRWDACDVVLITGDAYVDHPSFGAALIGRVLEAQGFRVGVIAQPDWRDARAFRALGRPRVMFGVTSGNMDSMVNRYTADGRRRSDDAYSPDDLPDLRPDRAALVYAQRCREAFPDVPVVLGGLEASLRRQAHFDVWSDSVRRSILVDSKAELLVYGPGERQVLAIACRLAAGEPPEALDDIAGTACVRKAGAAPAGGPGWVELPSFEEVARDPRAFARADRLAHRAALGRGGETLVQRHGEREVWIRPPAAPLSTADLDRVYELPYTRLPHPAYQGRRLKAWEMIAASVTIVRGCFGGCAFCALGLHAGRCIQSRSEDSVLREIARVRDVHPQWSGHVSDLGGPTANMYRMGCRRPEAPCARLSCLYPSICPQLETDHRPLVELYRRARQVAGVKKVLIGSGVRLDLAARAPEYVRELARHHVGGYLKVAPEHISPGPLAAMQKPGPEVYERFRVLFERASAEAGLEQYLVPYLVAGHPGTRDEDMLELALWLKRHDLRPEQVQTFLPTPMTLSTSMYHTGLDPRVAAAEGEPAPALPVPKGLRTRRLHKAFLRYHDPQNWPLLRAALRAMGRAELIGRGKHCLVPDLQPAGAGAGAKPGPPRGPRAEGGRRAARKRRGRG